MMALPAEICCVCHESLDPRGRVPLINPGCCGNQMHLGCFEQCRRLADPRCPLCRELFPVVQVPVQVEEQVEAERSIGLGRRLTQVRSNNNNNNNNNNNSLLDLSRQIDDALLGDRDDSGPAASEVTEPLITWTPAFDSVKKGSTDVTALLSLKAAASPSNPSDVSAVGVDLVVVVDVSASMRGRPLSAVKQTLRYVASCLTQNDRICIIQFSRFAQQLTKFRVCTPGSDGLVAVTRAIDGMKTQGGTNILSGCEYALRVLEGREEKNDSCAVLLLTDGQDNSVQNYSGFLREAEELNVPFYTYGFRESHDSALLSRISGKRGTFTYIPHPNVFQDAFAGTLGGIKSTIYKDLSLKISIPDSSEGVQLASIGCSHNYTFEDGVATISFGNLFAEEQRDVIVKFTINPELDMQSYTFAEVSCSYIDALTSQPISKAYPAFSLPLVESTITQSYNPLVVRQLLRLVALRQMEQCRVTVVSPEDMSFWMDDAIKAIEKTLIDCYNLSPTTQFNLYDPAMKLDGIPEEEWVFVKAIVTDLGQCGPQATMTAIENTYTTQRSTYADPNLNVVGGGDDESYFALDLDFVRGASSGPRRQGTTTALGSYFWMAEPCIEHRSD